MPARYEKSDFDCSRPKRHSSLLLCILIGPSSPRRTHSFQVNRPPARNSVLTAVKDLPQAVIHVVTPNCICLELGRADPNLDPKLLPPQLSSLPAMALAQRKFNFHVELPEPEEWWEGGSSRGVFLSSLPVQYVLNSTVLACSHSCHFSHIATSPSTQTVRETASANSREYRRRFRV